MHMWQNSTYWALYVIMKKNLLNYVCWQEQSLTPYFCVGKLELLGGWNSFLYQFTRVVDVNDILSDCVMRIIMYIITSSVNFWVGHGPPGPPS